MAKFEVLDCEGPDWPNIPAERRAAMLEALQNPQWRHGTGQRAFGFRQFSEPIPGVFAGYFAVQSTLAYLTYDDSGSPPDEKEVQEFERVLAVFMAEEGRWILHERRFFRTDLNKSLVRDLFGHAVRLANYEAGLGGASSIKPFEQYRTSEEMLAELLGENAARVIRISVDELHLREVPESFHFFNPRVDLDLETHILVNHDLEALDQADLEAAPNVDIRTSKLAQALARSGSVEYFATQDPAGRRRQVRRRVPPTFELDVDPNDPSVPIRTTVEIVVTRVLETYPNRYHRSSSPYGGGLFESLGGPHDENA
jgi:hypothetical protein